MMTNEDERKLLDQCESPIEQQMLRALLQYGVPLKITPQLRVGDYRIDLAVEHGGRRVAVECDGHEFHQTKVAAAHDARRGRVLSRMGWLVQRFTGQEIYQNAQACASEVVDALEAAKASPGSAPTVVSHAALMVPVALAAVSERPARGVRTGDENLDAAIGGWRSGMVTVFGAKRGFGKSCFSILAVDECLQAGARCLLFAAEDHEVLYGHRWMAKAAGVNATRLRDYHCTEGDLERCQKALAMASTVPFFVNARGRSAEWIAQAIRAVGKELADAKEPLRLVIVDYLQCVRAEARQQDRRNEMTYVTRTLVDAIKEIGAAGLLFSQLKRGDREEPDIEDLKESGDIENMAEHVLLGWIEEPLVGDTRPRRWLKVAKNKDATSQLGPIALDFDETTGAFRRQYTDYEELGGSL